VKARSDSLVAGIFVFAISCATSSLRVDFCQARGEQDTPRVKVNPLRDAYYGDLHLHTSYSLDAYIMGPTKVDPDAAYRFARGEVVDYFGQPVRRREPLDFLAVTDHSEYVGVFSELADPRSAVSQSEVGKKFRSLFTSFIRS